MNRKKSSFFAILTELSVRNPFPYLLIILFSFLLYFQTVNYGLVKFDDDKLVQGNYQFLSDVKNIGKALTTDVLLEQQTSYYRPVLTLSLMSDALLGGEKPKIYHITNVILHCLNCCLLFYLLTLLNFKRLYAFFGALVFACHPLFVLAVAWIPGRNDLLLTLFFLASFIMLLKYLEEQRIIFIIFHALFMGISLFTKETALMFPVIFLAFSIIYQKDKIVNLRNIILLAIYILFIAGFLIIRSEIVQKSVEYPNPVQNMLKNLPVIPELASKFFIPFNLAPIPFYNLLNVIPGIVILGGLIYFIFLFRKNTKKVKSEANLSDWKNLSLFGLGFFVLLLLPGTVVNFLGGKLFDYLEHRAYLPSIGLLVTIGGLLHSGKFDKERLMYNYFTIPIIAVFTALTFFHSQNYSDTLTFYNYALETNPASASPWNNKGHELLITGNFVESLNYFEKAISRKFDYGEAWNNKGSALFRLGRFEEAIYCYDKSLQIQPDFEAFNNKGTALLKTGKLIEAAQCYEKALGLKPGFSDAWYNMGLIYEKAGHLSKAYEFYDKALEFRPNFPEAWNNKGNILQVSGRLEESIRCYDKSLELNPSYSPAIGNRSIAIQKLRNKKDRRQVD